MTNEPKGGPLEKDFFENDCFNEANDFLRFSKQFKAYLKIIITGLKTLGVTIGPKGGTLAKILCNFLNHFL